MSLQRREHSPRHLRSTDAVGALSRTALVLGLTACAGCTDTSQATTGKEVVLHTRLVAAPERDLTFDTETGWSVTLSSAAVSLGALYFFDGGPAFVERTPSLWQRLATLLGPSVAYAHPGHYIAGSAVGQMLTPSVAALATEASDLPEGAGITGSYRSARVVLRAAAGADVSVGLKGNVAFAEGLAQKDDQRVHFKLAASFDEVARSVSKGEVDGCFFEDTEVRGDGTVTLTILPHVWFSLVDFSDIDPGTPDAPTEIGGDQTPHIAFALGVVQLSAYQFSFEADTRGEAP